MSEIKISTIVIQIQDKKLELTLEQAKELHRILEETFHKKEVQYIPSSPIVIDRYRDYRPYWWDVSYAGLGGTASTNSGALFLTCKSTNNAICGGNTSTPIK